MFLDFGIGLLVAVLASYLFDIPLTSSLVLFSTACAVLPDADFLYYFPKRNDTKYDHNHRGLIHYPLIYLPVGTITCWILLGTSWASIFFISSFFHFVHDSVGIGWGIRWLYPLSKNNYAFFYLYSKKIRRGLRKTIFVFDDKNLSEYVGEHGDANWIENIYYKWHPIAIVEFLFFITAVISLILYAR